MTMKYEIGALVLRVVLGITFFIHGLQKFQGGIENVAGLFETIGLPGFLAYIVAVIELAGGLALTFGIGTRIFSVLLGIIMIGAIFKVKLAAGFTGSSEAAGYEFDLALLAIAVYLGINGSQLLSLDPKLLQPSKAQIKFK